MVRADSSPDRRFAVLAVDPEEDPEPVSRTRADPDETPGRLPKEEEEEAALPSFRRTVPEEVPRAPCEG
jgi:hypothetical protein